MWSHATEETLSDLEAARTHIKSSLSDRPALKRNGHYGQRLFVALLCLAAFGPYVSGGVRTEQATVYLAACAAFLFFPALTSSSWRYVLPWVGIILIAMLTFVAPVNEALPWATGNALSGIDNLLLPPAVLFALSVFVHKDAARPALVTASKVIVWASAINAILAMSQTQGGMEPFLRPFWGAEEFASTVAIRAESMGRFSGIFNQPAEAGLVYSLAVILTIWLYANRPARLYVLLGLLVVGGILTVSKIFVFIGIPLGILYLFRSYTLRGRLLTLGGTAGLFGVVSSSGFVQGWTGFDYFIRLFVLPENGAVEFYSAGRWEAGSSVRTYISTTIETRPLTGFGLAGLSVPYDSAWTEIILISGLLGAALLGLVFWVMFHQARTTGDPDLRTLTYLVAIMLLASSLGVPSLTVNRAATLVWIIVTLLLLAREPRQVDRHLRWMSGAKVKMRLTGN